MRSLLLSIILIISYSMANGQDSFRVMTYNIRWANPNDGVNYWENRKERVYELVRDHNPDIIGMQEVVLGQLNDIRSNFPEYDWVGVGRDDGKDKGEFSPVFYKASRYRLLNWQTMWLSETPEVPSKGWDAALPRIATTCLFEDIETGKPLIFVNTHYDHVGSVARTESSKALAAKISSFGSEEAILLGDFNYESTAEGYRAITKVLEDAALPFEETEMTGTYRGFQATEDLGKRIDYVFYKKLKVLNYKVDERHDGKNYPSDHLPVIVDFRY